MDKAVTDRIERQVRSAFPDGAIARIQVLQYGDDPEVEPGQAAMRVFFDWPGRSEDKKATLRRSTHSATSTRRRSAYCARSCLASSDGSSSARRTRPGRPAPRAFPTGSPTADGRPPHAMRRRKTALP